jgi:chemotaxis regulatin CheY-phosphate phosphatase CheZ
MTQEELDELMAGDLDDELALAEEESEIAVDEDAEEAPKETNSEEMTEESDAEDLDAMIEDDGMVVIDEKNFKVDASKQWPPPPPTDDHKVVNQLDNVTRDSEKKATEIMDRLEEINNFVMDIETDANDAVSVLRKNIETYEKLYAKFPSIALFEEMIEENKKAKQLVEDMIEKSQSSADEIMMIMDIMQYQDIHRQKIERVINVMRALSKYMNSLFESSVDDESRVSSAVHIQGDSDTEDIVSEDEIEALLASFGQK